MITLFAWVGEDELGSGTVGLKRALVPAGDIPMVATARDKIDRAAIISQLQQQADRYGKTIRLIRCIEAETLIELHPRPQG